MEARLANVMPTALLSPMALPMAKEPKPTRQATPDVNARAKSLRSASLRETKDFTRHASSH